MLIAIIIVVLLVMSNYIKRTLQSKWRGVGDQFSYGRQYEPGLTQSYNLSDADIANWDATHPGWTDPF
jgi:hypothetical protein